MSIPLLYALHFDEHKPKSNIAHMTWQQAQAYIPFGAYFENKHWQGHMPPETMLSDWVDASVGDTGFQSTTLFCRGVGGSVSNVEDLVEFFQNHEIVWYKLVLTPSNRILRILKCHSFSLSDHGTSNLETGFPLFWYSLNSFVEFVGETDDGQYKTTTYYIDLNHHHPQVGP